MAPALRMARRVAVLIVVAYGTLTALLALFQRRLLYFPTHVAPIDGRLETWWVDGEVWGARRVVDDASGVWLVVHGNAGQAQQRDYVLDVLPRDACVYVLEYPGYGVRDGSPSRRSFDAAASAAYRRIATLHPGRARRVLGESIGSGPAAQLAREHEPPDAIVLATPFDRLSDVAAEVLPWLPVRWILRDDWDNGAALEGYAGRVLILAAEQDEVIAPSHARALARRAPRAELRLLTGGHNDWSRNVKSPLESK